MLVLPYVFVATVLLVLHRRVLDVLAVGDDEAATLGVPVGAQPADHRRRRARWARPPRYRSAD